MGSDTHERWIYILRNGRFHPLQYHHGMVLHKDNIIFSEEEIQETWYFELKDVSRQLMSSVSYQLAN